MGQGAAKRAHVDLARRHTVCLVMLTSGEIEGMWRGRPFRQTPRRLHIFWHTYPITYQHIADGTEALFLQLPFTWFMGLELPGPLTSLLLDGELIEVHPREPQATVDPILMRLACELIRSPSEARRQAGMLHCEARLRVEDDWLGQNTTSRASAVEHQPQRKTGPVEQMARFIAEHFAEDIHVEDITATAGINARHGMRLFKQATGTTLHAALVQHRLAEAVRLLSTQDAINVAEIATQSGFGSRTQLYQAFRRYYQTTPAAYRRRRRASQQRSSR